jgi:hypothetical protein
MSVILVNICLAVAVFLPRVKKYNLFQYILRLDELMTTQNSNTIVKH